MGRRTSRTLPLGMSETMTYDLAGQPDEKTDFNGQTTTYAYDVPEPAGHQDAGPGARPSRRCSFTYTVSGQRASMQDASGTTTYAYDNRDRLDREGDARRARSATPTTPPATSPRSSPATPAARP